MEAGGDRFEFGGFTLDRRSWTLLGRDGVPVALTPKAFDALVCFLERPGEVVDRATLVDVLWPDTVVEENNLRQVVAALRRAIGDEFIRTVPRRGYQFVAEVRVVPSLALRESGSADTTTVAASASPARDDGLPARDARRTRPYFWGSSLLIVVAAATLVLSNGLLNRSPEAVPKIAVLPCENMSPDPDDAYIAAGMHEEILNRLTQLSGLLVIARASVMQYAENRPSIPQIARELDASAVVECSVRHDGTGILVTAQLIDPRTDVHIWSDAYPADLSDLSGLFAMQADIAVNIANALDAELSPAEQRELEKLPTELPEAYAQYLKALQAGLELPDEAIGFLDRAIELDPRFAEAHATRGLTHLALARLAIVSEAPGFRPGDVTSPPEGAVRKAELAWLDAERALALDGDLGLAHLVAATRYGFPQRDSARYHAGLERALESSPNHSYVLFYVAGTYLAELRVDEAHTLVERLGQVDPNFPDLGWLLWMSGDLDGAWTHARRRLEWNPADIRAREGMVTLETMRGNAAEAIVHLRILNEMLAAEGIDLPLFYGSGYVYKYGRLGLADEARQAFEEVLKDRDAQYPASWIYHYLGIGDIESALEAAEQLAERPLPPWVEIDHYFVLNVTRDPVLERLEFLELRRKLGFRGD